MSWAAVGSSSQIPGPVTAVEVDNGNASSIFAAGQSVNLMASRLFFSQFQFSSTDGSSVFLLFWNGAFWTTLGTTVFLYRRGAVPNI